ncbi:hypothetical protein J6590_041155 [Homalodisca vitripennis]|nr:hypothetical protein J6590_041155 [Homalodisca vitripennis]
MKLDSEIYPLDQRRDAFSQVTATLYHSSTPNHSAPHNTSIQELERSLEENGVHNYEEKLEMAAKIGAALLKEKRILEKEKTNLMANLASLEAKLEETNETEEKYLKKIEILLENVYETEKQLEKEKQHRLHLQAAFEEQDCKQTQTLNEYLTKIKELEKTITQLRREIKQNEVIADCTTEEHRPYKESDTNRHFSKNQPESSLDIILLLLEMAQLKSKQDILEQEVKRLETEMTQSKQEVTLEANKQTDLTIPHSLKIHSLSTLKRANTPNKNKNKTLKIKKNHFSISLQMAKSKSKQPILHPAKKAEETSNGVNPALINKKDNAPYPCNIWRKIQNILQRKP